MINNMALTSFICMALVFFLSIKSSLFFFNYYKNYLSVNPKTSLTTPPQDFNPIDFAILSFPQLEISLEKLISIIIYYANKGLITISYKNDQYSLIQNKKVYIDDFDNLYEYNFFTSLFSLLKKSNGNLAKSKTRKSDLKFFNDFLINSKAENCSKKVYLSFKNKNINYIFFMISYPLAIISLITFLFSITKSIYLALVLTLIISLILIATIPLTYILKSVNYYFSIIVNGLFLSIVNYFVLNLKWFDTSNLDLLPLIYISFGFSLLTSQYLPLKFLHTDLGLKVKGHAIEFINFLKNNKNSSFIFSKDESTYFYEILPYAICLNQEETLNKILESFNITNPFWYKGSIPFSYNHFYREFLSKLLQNYYITWR